MSDSFSVGETDRDLLLTGPVVSGGGLLLIHSLTHVSNLLIKIP